MCDVLPTHENEPTEVLSLNKTGKVLTSAKKTTLLTKAKQLRKVTLFEQLCNLFFFHLFITLHFPFPGRTGNGKRPRRPRNRDLQQRIRPPGLQPGPAQLRTRGL